MAKKGKAPEADVSSANTLEIDGDLIEFPDVDEDVEVQDEVTAAIAAPQAAEPAGESDEEAHSRNLKSAREKLSQGVGLTDLKLVEQIALLRDEQDRNS